MGSRDRRRLAWAAVAVLVAALLVVTAATTTAPRHHGWDLVEVIAKHPDGPRLRVALDPVADEDALARGPKPEAPPPVRVDALAHAGALEEYRLAPFRGLSTWVDLYDVDLSSTQQVELAAAHGVDTIFVQTARFNSDTDIHDYLRLSELIESAHDAGLQVVVWYIPDFVDLHRDLRRSQAAMAMITPRGDRPDAFGLDIEVDDVPDVAERSRRLLELSAALRSWVGPEYPMAAIVLPPLQLELNTTWWPAFPYAELAAFYDVFVPMSYSSFRGTDAETTYTWNLANVVRTRELVGDPAVPVHLAGGIADDLPEVAAFVAAAHDGAVVGAGLYDLHTTQTSAWSVLGGLTPPDGG